MGPALCLVDDVALVEKGPRKTEAVANCKKGTHPRILGGFPIGDKIKAGTIAGLPY